MKTLVFLVEEPSMKAFLKGILPQLLPQSLNVLNVKHIVFKGKQDLDRQVVKRMRLWQLPDSYFVIIRDQDSADCKLLKEDLIDKCRSACRPDSLVRIACKELESWYLGDLTAVRRGLGLKKAIETHQQKSKYRHPDSLSNPKQELKKLTGNIYQPLSGSRAIVPFMDIHRNQSVSFQNTISGLRRLINRMIS